MVVPAGFAYVVANSRVARKSKLKTARLTQCFKARFMKKSFVREIVVALLTPRFGPADMGGRPGGVLETQARAGPPRRSAGLQDEPSIGERWPRRAQDRRDQQDGAEVYHRRRTEGANFQHATRRLRFSDQSDHYELQPGQCSGRRADYDIETFPTRKR